MVGPGYNLISDWIIGGWKELKKNLIEDSFLYCGLTNNYSSYHSELKKIILNNIIPENTTVIANTDVHNQDINQMLFIDDDYEDLDYDENVEFDAFNYR